jgi:hypothetical protein
VETAFSTRSVQVVNKEDNSGDPVSCQLTELAESSDSAIVS